MADERDFELLDDYLTNRMSEQDRSAFEQKLQADPDLQHEFSLQQRLINGIRDARAAQLKSMLNQVPVPVNGPGTVLLSKILVGTVVSVILGAATYWYVSRKDVKIAEPGAPSQEQITNQSDAQSKTPGITEEKQPSSIEKQTVESDKNQTSAGTEHSKPSLAKKPDPVQAPADKNADEESANDSKLKDAATETRTENQPIINPRTSGVMVETDRENTSYTFHYQFREGKVLLYGPFEKNLYEIVELYTDEKRTVFLYYKEQYYQLVEATGNIQPLSPVTDANLLKKLRDNRR